jgi:hypothetical protein
MSFSKQKASNNRCRVPDPGSFLDFFDLNGSMQANTDSGHTCNTLRHGYNPCVTRPSSKAVSSIFARAGLSRQMSFKLRKPIKN